MIVAVVQARMGSTRLPGKVLKPILGAPMLERQLERVRHCERIDKLIVATSIEPEDDEIAVLCARLEVACRRGSLGDVLDRFYTAASPENPDHVVRLTADCPLADPSIIDEVISLHVEGGYDYTSNTLTPTYPDGLDVEVFRFECLERAWRQAKLASEREHVTPFMHKPEVGYRLGRYQAKTDLSRLRWTVDEPADYLFVCEVYAALYPKNPAFNMTDIVQLLDDRPELLAINSSIERNLGYAKSLANDFSIEATDK